jgi:hypothetical protein
MYQIIGGDQREYGPASAEDVRRWIAEGRLNQHSMAKRQGEPEWKTLGEFAEFESALSAHEAPPPPLAGPASPPVNPEIWISEMLAREPNVPVGLCLSRSWDLLRGNFHVLFTSCLLVWGIGMVQFLPFVGYAYNVLTGVFYGGLCLVFLKRIRSEPTKPGEVFDAFNLAFVQLLLVGVVMWVLTRAGLCLCVVPGVFLFVAWIFAVPLVADKRLEFWSAMELSRKVVTRVWFPVFLLLVLAFLPVILLSFATFVKGSWLGLGMAIDAIRTQSQDVGRIMERAWQINAQTFTLKFFTRLVLLINLPFAMGALLYAYENLFGPRTTRTS